MSLALSSTIAGFGSYSESDSEPDVKTRSGAALWTLESGSSFSYHEMPLSDSVGGLIIWSHVRICLKSSEPQVLLEYTFP